VQSISAILVGLGAMTVGNQGFTTSKERTPFQKIANQLINFAYLGGIGNMVKTSTSTFKKKLIPASKEH